MLNQAIICGRLTDNPVMKENEKGKIIITLAIPRTYKNAEGIYETDFITCELWSGIAETVTEHCKKGDLLGIRGRLETGNIANDDGDIIAKTTTIIAEKVSFLSCEKSGDK